MLVNTHANVIARLRVQPGWYMVTQTGISRCVFTHVTLATSTVGLLTRRSTVGHSHCVKLVLLTLSHCISHIIVLYYDSQKWQTTDTPLPPPKKKKKKKRTDGNMALVCVESSC